MGRSSRLKVALRRQHWCVLLVLVVWRLWMWVIDSNCAWLCTDDIVCRVHCFQRPDWTYKIFYNTVFLCAFMFWKILLANGASINAVDICGWTALMNAAFWGNLKTMEVRFDSKFSWLWAAGGFFSFRYIVPIIVSNTLILMDFRVSAGPVS